WRRVRSGLAGPRGRMAGRGRAIGPGLSIVDGEVHLFAADEPVRAETVLWVADAAAAEGCAIERGTLQRLATTDGPPEPWPESTRALFVALLGKGRSAIPVIEALDQQGSWEALLPEWSAVRARPQHNPYHRFTVDRHLLETVAHVASRAD